MKSRFGPRLRVEMGYCRIHHVKYPLNFSYGGVLLANCCPHCDPSWQARLKEARRRELDTRHSDHTAGDAD